MMIKMLVHQDGPLVRCERTEKAVWVFGAAIRSGGNEPTDQSEQSLSLDFQISLIFHDESLNGWRISPHGLVVSEYQWLYSPPNESTSCCLKTRSTRKRGLSEQSWIQAWPTQSPMTSSV